MQAEYRLPLKPLHHSQGISMKPTATLAATALLTLAVTACAPEVGSKQWCDNMQEKPKGEWSMNEAADFAKHCIFPKPEE
jgi:hypothetical protein